MIKKHTLKNFKMLSVIVFTKHSVAFCIACNRPWFILSQQIRLKQLSADGYSDDIFMTLNMSLPFRLF